VVERDYLPIDDPEDVVRAPDGSWQIRAGARVAVRVAVAAPAARRHVALIDPLPAGFEPLIPGLRGEGPGLADPSGWSSWQEQQLRDDRAEAFASRLEAGVHEVSYTARATTAGTFTAPAARAEEQYAPETFGEGSVEVVVVR
jgi:uncharacterized protein YfaS (alpha-2-macroglobulin family)